MEEQNVSVDPVETVEPSEPTEPTEQGEPSEIDVAQLQATNKKLYERAKNAEAALKAAKANPAPSQPANVEESVLRANGVDEELIEELKLRAPGHGGSLIKAQKDPKYIAVKEKFEKDQKSKEASLPGSRGAGSVKAQKTFNSPGLSRDEHRAMVLGK